MRDRREPTGGATSAPPSGTIWRAAAAVAALGLLAGCAQTAGGPATETAAPAPQAPAPAAPKWLVGYVWPVLDDGPILTSARRTLAECALPRAAGLSGARIEDAPRGLTVRAPDGGEKIALAVFTPPDQPAARELRMRWAPEVGSEGRVAVLVGTQRILKGEPPCPPEAG